MNIVMATSIKINPWFPTILLLFNQLDVSSTLTVQRS